MDAALAPPLFLRVLGGRADALHAPVLSLHQNTLSRRYAGQVRVRRGRNPLARWCAWLTHLPPAGEGPVEVEIVPDGAGERWIRHIGGRAMRSRLWAGEGLLCERLGPVEFGFRLVVRDGDLHWTVARVRLWGQLALPAHWFTGVGACESVFGERYTFDVHARLPLLGLLVHYRGWLDVP
jgi:hypothetical protein